MRENGCSSSEGDEEEIMLQYILVSNFGGTLSVLSIWIFDPDIDEGLDNGLKDPYTFSENARAYTEHGIPLERGLYPWGNIGDLYPYSAVLFERLRIFADKDDFDGYQNFFKEEVLYVPGINYVDD